MNVGEGAAATVGVGGGADVGVCIGGAGVGAVVGDEVGVARTSAGVGDWTSRAKSGVVSASPQAASENGAANSAASVRIRAKTLTVVSYAPRVRILIL